MATRANLINTYNSNPTLQSRYTLQQYLDLFGFGATTTTPTTTTTTPTQTPATPGIPNIINQNLRQGDDGPKGDFGIFGNLDKSTAKDFNVQVYDEELGDFVDTTITGYKNVNSGLYQDKFGKNLQPLLSNKGAIGLAGIIAEAIGLEQGTVGGFKPGSIRGKYDNFSDIFKQKQIRTQQSIQQELAKKAMQEDIAKAEADEAAKQARLANAVTYQYNNPSARAPQDDVDRASDAATYGGATIGAATYTDRGREGYGYGLADGGKVKMAGYLNPISEKNDMAMEMFGKQLKDLTDSELELLNEEIDRLRSKFMADGGRVYLYNRLK